MKGIIIIEKSEEVFEYNRSNNLKDLLPIYDRPMIQFPISVLMQLGIREIIIAAPLYKMPQLEGCIGDGSRLGICIDYQGYDEKRGELAGILSCESLIEGQQAMVIKGDNIFYGEPFYDEVLKSIKDNLGHTGFATRSTRQARFGNKNKYRANRLAVPTDLHLYDCSLLERVKHLYDQKHSNSLADLNNCYDLEGNGCVQILNPWVAWMKIFDHESLLGASNFIFQLEKTHGIKTACLEEVAYRLGFISKSQFYDLYKALKGSAHADYLLHFLEDREGRTEPLDILLN